MSEENRTNYDFPMSEAQIDREIDRWRIEEKCGPYPDSTRRRKLSPKEREALLKAIEDTPDDLPF